MKVTVSPTDVPLISPILMALVRAYPHREQEVRALIPEAMEHGFAITLEATAPHHTDQQRGYYHKWKNAFAEWCGNTPDEMHEILLGETYGTETVTTKMGEVTRPLARSSTAGRVEYSRLIDTLVRVAADTGFYVPPPWPRRPDHAATADL